jgi:ATP phosphoribosyltransferase
MITCAIPTGRLGEQTLQLLFDSQVTKTRLDPKRKLIIIDELSDIRYIFVKPSDVITYVYSGNADIGIVGSDSIEEEKKQVYELLDLNIGRCDLVVAGKDMNILKQKEVLRVATKYTSMTKAYFESINQDIEIVDLKGSVELAPLIDVSDIIVDITETGTTLKENGLIIFKTIQHISARLITNKASYVLKNDILIDLKEKLKVKL